MPTRHWTSHIVLTPPPWVLVGSSLLSRPIKIKTKPNPWLAVTCFPALGTNFKYLLRVLIGYLIASMCCNWSELESESVGFSSVRLNGCLNIVLTANSGRLTGHFRCLLWSYPGKTVKPTIFTTLHQDKIRSELYFSTIKRSALLVGSCIQQLQEN